MAKLKKAYFCQNCGAEHAQWQGQCNSCKSWNTLIEEVIEKETLALQWSETNNNAIQNAIYIVIYVINRILNAIS